jgi:hypothetical protein
VKAQVSTRILKDCYAILIVIREMVILLIVAALGGGSDL